MKLEHDKVYHFEVENYAFGDLPKEELAEIFKDGRIAGKLLEPQLSKWFPELTHVDVKGYDHIDESGHKDDAKSFTKRGSNFAPSIMVGGGRSIDFEVAAAHASGISYIFCEVDRFPLVRVVAKRGSEMVDQYPSFKVSNTDQNRQWLFG